MMENLCINCFNERTGEDICPYCGYAGEEPEDNSILPPGTSLKEKYILGKALGRGGFGVSYLAYDTNLSMKVCIKEYFPSSISTRNLGTTMIVPFTGDAGGNYEYGKDKFVDEGRTLAKFNSVPSVVTVHDFFTANGTAYIVMEYLDGVDLSTFLKNQPDNKLSWEKTIEIINPILSALTEVHMQGVIHRDISPDNIFITKYNSVKLLDFGAARFAFGEHAKSMSVILKYGYAPPEQYSRGKKQGPWTDVYAICATIYKCLTGETPPDSMDRMADDEMKLPSELGSDIPEYAEKVLLKGLEVQFKKRLQSAEDLINEFAKKESHVTRPANVKAKDNKSDKEKYDLAVAAFNDKNFKDAYNLFLGLGEYKDSKSYMEKARGELVSGNNKDVKDIPVSVTGSGAVQQDNRTVGMGLPNQSVAPVQNSVAPGQNTAADPTEQKYQRACVLLNGKKYKLANRLFSELGQYKDSAQKLVEIAEKKKKSSAKGIVIAAACIGSVAVLVIALLVLMPLIRYNRAKNLVLDNDFDKGIQIFEDLGSYRDSERMVTKSKYSYAISLLDDGDYEESIEVFNDVIDYKDAEKDIKEAKYLLAEEMIENKQLDKAKELMDEISPYPDDRNLSSELNYQMALEFLSKGQFDEAEELLEELAEKNYKDSETQLKEVIYQRSRSLQNDSKYLEAYIGYKEIIGYKDANGVALELANKLYSTAVSYYQDGSYGKAYDIFAEIRVSKKTNVDKYLYIMVAELLSSDKAPYKGLTVTDCAKMLDSLNIKYTTDQSKTKVYQIFNFEGKVIFDVLYNNPNFENTHDIFLSDLWIGYFLNGDWEGSNLYIRIYEGNNEDANKGLLSKNYWCSYNIPRFSGDYKYYKVEDGIFYLGSDEDGWVKQWRYEYMDKKHIKVYSYQSKKTYTLTRQDG